MIHKRSLVRRSTVLAASGAAALVLAACGGDDGSPAGHGGHSATASATASASPGQHNAADTAFAKGMIPHHRQAVEMAGLAPGRARSAAVKKLAADIKKAQGPEIRTLSGWLTSWGEQVPAEGAADHSMHGSDGMEGMSGMMTDEEMTELENASGTAFDTAFMELMIKHHEGAVDMARTEQADGAYGPARKMAGDIVISQSAEIAQMRALLGKD
ncbi:lipoprotein [Streptomyces malachitofuscus]|nr:lipoprotein [Streptomyces malachitofuscus]